MKAISLTQPWATLVALGAKRIETRGWRTDYRGPLAIHAAKGLKPVGGFLGFKDLCQSEPFRSVLKHVGVWPDDTDMPPLPLGRIVAVCELADCLPTDRLTLGSGFIELYDRTNNLSSVRWTLTDQERAFGDYSPGRFAWLLADVRALPEPIPCKGTLGLWEWDGGEG